MSEPGEWVRYKPKRRRDLVWRRSGISTWRRRLVCALLGHWPRPQGHPRIDYECGRGCGDYVLHEREDRQGQQSRRSFSGLLVATLFAWVFTRRDSDADAINGPRKSEDQGETGEILYFMLPRDWTVDNVQECFDRASMDRPDMNVVGMRMRHETRRRLLFLLTPLERGEWLSTIDVFTYHDTVIRGNIRIVGLVMRPSIPMSYPRPGLHG